MRTISTFFNWGVAIDEDDATGDFPVYLFHDGHNVQTLLSRTDVGVEVQLDYNTKITVSGPFIVWINTVRDLLQTIKDDDPEEWVSIVAHLYSNN